VRYVGNQKDRIENFREIFRDILFSIENIFRVGFTWSGNGVFSKEII